MKAREIIYRGRVQGVGFRYSVKQLAAGYDVSGYVENMGDGSVRLLVQGSEHEMDELQRAVVESHLSGLIREIDVQDVVADTSLRGFEIQR